MRIKCTFRGIGLQGRHYEPGDVILAPWLASYSICCPNYNSTWRKSRPPILVCLPNQRLWSPELVSADSKEGWLVTGDLDFSLSIEPSVICMEPNGKNLKYRVKGGYIYLEDNPI